MSFAQLRAKAEAAAANARERTQAYTESASSKYIPARTAPLRAPKPTTLSAFPSTGRSTPSNPAQPPHTPSLAPSPRPPARALSSTASTSSSASVPFTRASTSSVKSFAHYDSHDKHDMFAALDLFFSSRETCGQDHRTPRSHALPSNVTPLQRTLPPTSTITSAPVAVSSSPPPRAPLSTRPGMAQAVTPSPTVIEPSYPPPESCSSSALALSEYVLREPFATRWFSDPRSPVPPPLVDRSDHQSSFSWQQRNDSKQFIGMTVFGDRSVAWYRVSWRVSLESSDDFLNGIEREAKSRPIPSPWDGQQMFQAHERYGPRLADFARRAVSNRVPIGRGECWDLAHEGLETLSNEFSSRDPDLKPFVSIGRTHGQLMFWAHARARQDGRWYGGDLYVREGDIVEWRSVKIREVGASPGSYSILGDPDHTAIIIETGSPTSLPDPNHPSPSSSSTEPYCSYSPSCLTSLTVVEQSLGQIPTRTVYDLTSFSEGEIWIYRPCGIKELLGGVVEKIEAVWPPPTD